MSDLGNDTKEVVNPQTLEFKRSIKDAAEAHAVAKRIEQDNQERTNRASKISERLNDAQPYSQSKLVAAAQGWRHNRSTGFLSSFVKRIIPPYKQAIDEARFITSATLNEESPEAEQKDNDFRSEFTNSVRRWQGWDNLCYLMIMENVVYGYCAVGWTDDIEWRPKSYRTDEAMFPDGTGQLIDEVDVWVLKQSYFIHQLADKLADPQSSKSAGWNPENIVKALNNAQAKPSTESTVDARRMEDSYREANLSASFSSGVKKVCAYHVFSKEANGMVSHFMVEEKTGDELFTRYDQFASMADCLSLYSVEVGNGSLHGSKGAGRSLYNTAIAAEQSRNLICDMLYISGLLLMKTTARSKNKTPIVVAHPCGIVQEGFEVVEHGIKVNPDAFFALDNHLTKLAELQVGAFMPGRASEVNGGNPSASEVNFVAAVEQSIKQGVLSRFYTQYQQMIYTIQKRFFSPDNIAEAVKRYDAEMMAKESQVKQVAVKIVKFMARIGKAMTKGSFTVVEEVENPAADSDAVTSIVRLLRKKHTPDEIMRRAECAPQTTERDDTREKNLAIDMVVSRYAGNPKVNQQKLMTKDISSKLGYSIAEELVIPDTDQTITQEAVRMQAIELMGLAQGQEMPVSPRDEDKVHMDYIISKVGEQLPLLMQGGVTPETFGPIKGIFMHFGAHLESAKMKNPKDDLKKYEQFLQEALKAMQSAEVSLQQQEAAAQAAANLPGQPFLPPGDPNADINAQTAARESANAELQATLPNSQTDVMAEAMRTNPNPAAAAAIKPLSRGPINMQPKMGQQ